MELFNIELINFEDFGELLFRFLINLIVVFVTIRFIYYPIRKRKDYLFTYILISATIFLLCFLLENVKLELGFALGLFAIFGIIRYRTRQIPIKEMTYLFLVIGISVINALANKKVSYAELIITNLLLVVLTLVLEKLMLLKHESTKTINYEKIELIKPENRKELIEDLEMRTGIKINRVEVGRIDFLRDTARVSIYYFESENTENLADDEEPISDDDDD
ncbi:MAG: DUF4956 domain-containing protein [Prolixibacteraceae bacterium]|nr:DUF4956 domain-containing protein [Prolixibacteraceae bacterium]